MSEQTDTPVRRKAPAVAAAAHLPYMPPPWENADALSLRRVAAGNASSVEQQRAIAWIMKATGYTDEPFRPGGEDGRRNTDFALGKAFIGRQIAKLLNVDLSRIRGGKDVENP